MSNQVHTDSKPSGPTMGQLLAPAIGIRPLLPNDRFERIDEFAEQEQISIRDVLNAGYGGHLRIYVASDAYVGQLPRWFFSVVARDGFDAIQRTRIGLAVMSLGFLCLCAAVIYWAAVFRVGQLGPGFCVLTVLCAAAYCIAWAVILRNPIFVDMNSVSRTNSQVDRGLTFPSRQTAASNSQSPIGSYVSTSLSLLNEAANRLWANADLKERDTLPTNKYVSKWLVERGMSKSLANKSATIIRPDWAPSGRPPEE